jgi:hypothetical protein
VQIPPVVVVLEIERAVVSVSAVLDLDDRHRSHADVLDQGFLDLLPAVLVGHVRHHEIVAFGLVLKEVHPAH